MATHLPKVVRTALASTLLVAALLCTGGGSALAAEGAANARTVEVTIKSGDTLLKIAARHGVSIEELRKWNPKRVGKGDLIKAGERLVIHVPEIEQGPPAPPTVEWEGWYDIKSGDTLGGVAKKLDVRLDDLRRWNRLRPGGVIRAGDMLKYKKVGVRPPAKSTGRPTKGKLHAGEHLGEGHGYRLRFPKNAFGIPSVLSTLKVCAAHVAEKHPGTADILIGDISKPTGGRFPPHVSHQSGRDADIGYYQAKNVQNVTMHRVRSDGIDHEKNWVLLKCLLERDEVVRVYMDHRIQAAMARFLQKKGFASEDLLARLFEVRAADPSTALIRHAPAHDTHIHVRFACDAQDPKCAEEPDDSMFKF